jgi:hypothetical protein
MAACAGTVLSYPDRMSDRACVDDIHDVARAMPFVTVWESGERPIYQVGGKSFVFFRSPRPDAVDPETGERYPDVVMFWVASLEEKLALVQDASLPFFTTAHFDGYPSVLLRTAHVGKLSRGQLAEVVQDAWLSRASPTRAARWLRENGLAD